MKFTLLELVQTILSAMDSDEVNSIGDTTESQQVATLIKTTYNDIISRANLPEHFDLYELNASLDPNKPTIMHRPNGAQSILWIKYDTRMVDEVDARFNPITYLEPREFIDTVFSYRDQNQNDVIRYEISTPNSSSIEIVGLNNKAPNYWTSWDDELVVFDSYDSAVDGTLMKNKTMVYGEWEPVFLMQDSFVPDLDSRQFSLLLNEAKALAFAELKQTTHERAERTARRAWITLAHQKDDLPAGYSFFNTVPNYGRKRR